MSNAADIQLYRALIAPFDRHVRVSRTQVRSAMRGIVARLKTALEASSADAVVAALPLLLPDETIHQMLTAIYLRSGVAAAEAFANQPAPVKSSRVDMQLKRIAPKPDGFTSLRIRLLSLSREVLGNERVQKIASKTRDLVAGVLSGATAAASTLVRQVRKALLKSSRLDLIARTETLYAWSVGSQWAAKAAGRTSKRWIPVLDGRTRDAHAAMARKPAVGIDETFIVGGEAMRYPGDPNGSAGNVINCRCTLFFE
ncbi:phage minor head protein [Fibrella forsythiae]|uniref:Phage head morphogenesis domain-containing protein n=1 Tax=Fibrella forsythiae TaxID=2817061 RepID=A0ABS3JC03_9BACT|nr:phage minor head protein [Fibrella forsythiae]MBO0947531.1 hypothetical protein [Fibrella forsythiae]